MGNGSGSDDSAAGKTGGKLGDLPPERQRPAATIDLKASEVSSRAIGGEDKPAAPGGTKAPEAGQDSTSGSAAGSAQTTSPESAVDLRPLHSRPVLWAAAAGGAISLFALGTFLGASWMNRDDQLSQIAARLARIEVGLSSAPATETAVKAAADNVASLNKRLDEIAGNVRDARSRADNAVSAAETAQKAAGNVPQQDRGDTEALAGRIATLEQSTKSNERELAADDKVSRRALVASALRDAVERGNSFTAELAAAKSFAADAAVFAPLEIFASSGVPSAAMLARELQALTQPMIKAIGEPVRTGGVMDRIQASAERLVRIRPVGDAQGDDPAQVIARIEVKAARNDIAGALSDLAKLPMAVRAPAEPWIKRAAARDAAIAASRLFAQDSLGALGASGKPSQ